MEPEEAESLIVGGNKAARASSPPRVGRGRRRESGAAPSRRTNALVAIVLGLATGTASFLLVENSSLGDSLVRGGGGPDRGGEAVEAALGPMLEEWKGRAGGFAASSSAAAAERPLPSEDRPFVFFHQRKAGGSTLRLILHESSEARNLTSWIACQDADCVPFSLPPNSEPKAVYAGHVNADHMKQLIRELRGGQGGLNTSDANLTIAGGGGEEIPTEVAYHSMESEEAMRSSFGTCLTNIRPTVDRVKSCWNFRMRASAPEAWRLPDANDMSAADWDALLPDAIDRYGNGCNNEIARIFGSTQDEKAVNRLSVGADGRRFVDELETVLSRMAGCVIVRLDRCEDSKTILKHYLPWVDADDLCETHLQAIDYNRTALAGDAREVILRHNLFDDLAFDFGARLFEEQLRVAAAAST